MTFVLDASTTLAWWFEDEATPASEKALERLDEESALVPALWELEVTNGLLVGERPARLSESQTARFVTLLSSLPITIDLTGPVMSDVLATARRHGLSSYDATYLTLAEREGLPLATLDDRLRAAATAAGVRVL